MAMRLGEVCVRCGRMRMRGEVGSRNQGDGKSGNFLKSRFRIAARSDIIFSAAWMAPMAIRRSTVHPYL